MTFRTSHRTARKHAITLAAVLALLAQSVFPHIHGWQGRGTPAPAVAAADRCTVDCPVVIATATTADHGGDPHHHSPVSCPLCRVQSDARSALLPPAFAVPLPVAAPATFVTDVVFATASVVRVAAAPRAPPLAS